MMQKPRLRVTLLGATGSIGRSAVDVLLRYPDRFSVESVVAGCNALALAETALRLKARFAALADPAGFKVLAQALSGSGIEFAVGSAAVREAAMRAADIVIAGISGTAGLEPTHAALGANRRIALANKECLVCAGAAFMRAAHAVGATVFPLDSEHNAVFQALGSASIDDVEAMTLTASGGPFLNATADGMENATPEQALRHPTWSMGAKVTIDSASLMNKGLELIEAHHLFGVDPSRLDVLIHPQSIVHGLVRFKDGSTVAGCAPPDMRVAIAHGLGYPERLSVPVAGLDLARIGALTFANPDHARFPCLGLAQAALKEGGAAPTVLNAANEAAVEAFLNRQIGFMDIPRLVEATCVAVTGGGEPATVREALDIDHAARETAHALLPVCSQTVTYGKGF